MTTRGVLFAAVLLVCPASDGSAQTPPVQPGTIVLDKGWQTPIQGGGATIEDLGAILSPFAQPSADTSKAPRIKIYQGVGYLSKPTMALILYCVRSSNK